MAKIAICILVSLAVQAQAKRVQIQKLEEALQQAEVEQEKTSAELEIPEEEELLAQDDAEEEREKNARPEDAYWYTNAGSWDFLVPSLMSSEHTQQYKLKENSYMWQTKKYDIQLQEYENPETGTEVRKKIDAEVLRVENHFWTMHAEQTAVFKKSTELGHEAGEYVMFNPRFFARHYTWRVAKKGDKKNVLFTIQKRLYADHCTDKRNWFNCKPVIKIYVGKRGDKSTLIYYGVGDTYLEEPDFKFYHSRAAYIANKENWAGEVEYKGNPTWNVYKGDEYKVKVKPNEDTALLLLASICLDKVGDDAREPGLQTLLPHEIANGPGR